MINMIQAPFLRFFFVSPQILHLNIYFFPYIYSVANESVHRGFCQLKYIISSKSVRRGFCQLKNIISSKSVLSLVLKF